MRKKRMSKLQDLLDVAGLTRVSSAIMQVAVPSIRLTAHPMDEVHFNRGATKFGGSPDLAQGMVWPERDGVPLPFVAQINMAEVASYDRSLLLPDVGMLYFFFDIDAFFDASPHRQHVWQVVYESDNGLESQAAAASEAAVEIHHYCPCAVTYSVEITLPDYSQNDPFSVGRLGLAEQLTDEEEQAYYIVQAQLADTAGTASHVARHRLLGYPDVIQWDMSRDLDGTPTDWQLLFQVDSDGALNTEWGDTGRIYYWIRTRDLMKRDFKGVELILQST